MTAARIALDIIWGAIAAVWIAGRLLLLARDARPTPKKGSRKRKSSNRPNAGI